MPDTVIGGRYQLGGLLGRGGMSEVYSADDLELGRRVALKLLAPEADRARFQREARAVASLAHPNVMQLYDYGEDRGRPYMVLEYVPGGTLEDRLVAAAGRPLPDEDARTIATGVAAGLAHAHTRGVVHRDLKPANVLFDGEGRPKLGDFGIARLAAGEGTLTEAGTVLGTAAYISPEQASGEPASPASDVYSFGVILYRMLTGRLPFESSDPLELVMMNRDLPPPPVATYRDDPPGRLEATAMAALEKRPADRPHDGAALLAALGGAAAADDAATRVLPIASAPATTVLPAPPPARPQQQPPRSRMPLLVAALLVLLLAGGALAYEMTRPASSSTPPTATIPSTTLPKSTTTLPTTQPQTTEPATTRETTQQTTAQRTTTAPPTTQAPPTTTALPPTITELPTTTAPTTTPTEPLTTAGTTLTAP